MAVESAKRGTLALIIPVLDEVDQIDDLLDSLQPLRQRGVELILVDGGSGDGTPQRTAGRCDRLLESPPGRAHQMNLGARYASADFLVFLHADSRLPAELVDRDWHPGGDWGFFPVRLRAIGWIWRAIEFGINLRSRLTGIGTGDQAIFCARHLFEQVGGFPPLPLMEDIAICKTLRQLAPPWVARQPVRISPRRWQANGVLRTTFLMWWLRLLYCAGVPAESIADRYDRLRKRPADPEPATGAPGS